MDRAEMELIYNALERINHSLDERFEKNADLYIAPENVEWLKHAIYTGNYIQIADKFKLRKMPPQVLTNVLIKNAWLMRNSNYKVYVRPILEACDYPYLTSVMRDGVFDNKKDMPTEFRLMLIETFLRKSSAETCKQMLGFHDKLLFLNNTRLKAICVCQAIKDEPMLSRYNSFNTYVGQWENLSTQGSVFTSLFKSQDFDDRLRDTIFDDQIKNDSPTARFWVERLGADDVDHMMRRMQRFCRMNSSNVSTCKAVLGRLFPLIKKNLEVFANGFAAACSCMDDKGKVELAKSGLSRVSDKNADEETALKTALERQGIRGAERGNLANIPKIIEMLNSPGYGRAMSYLIISFDKHYRADHVNALNQIRSSTNRDRFETFCCNLAQRRDLQLQYLIYVLDELIPANATKTHPIVRQMLDHIQNKDVLKRQKTNPLVGRVIDFVKAKDFELFRKLMAF